MDSITHLVLGGCIGQVLAGKTLGKKAVFLGMVGQSIPDIDFIGGLWMTEAEHILAHRGLTHSILFGLTVTLLLAWIFRRLFQVQQASFPLYILLFGVNIGVHILLDTCNAYGTALFYPFTDLRYSFHLLFVADPLFSLIPFVACVGLVFGRGSGQLKKRIAYAGILSAVIYTGFAFRNKMLVVHTLEQEQLPGKEKARKIITPTLFNTFLWYIIEQEEDGYQIGYRSVFDKDTTIQFHFFPKKDTLLAGLTDKHTAAALIRFADDFYTIEQQADSLVLNVLRFGQVGWSDNSSRFAFYYYLNHPEANHLTIQRGRLQEMDAEGWRIFLRRIAGQAFN